MGRILLATCIGVSALFFGCYDRRLTDQKISEMRLRMMFLDILLTTEKNNSDVNAWEDAVKALFHTHRSRDPRQLYGEEECIVNPSFDAWLGNENDSNQNAVVVKVVPKKAPVVIYAINFSQSVSLLSESQFVEYSKRWTNLVFSIPLEGKTLYWCATNVRKTEIRGNNPSQRAK